MKLLLTSAGLTNKELSDTFLKLLTKPAGEIQLIFIPTASRTKEELTYVKRSWQELSDLGINNITTLNLNREVTNDEIKNADVIYMCGGNTFYLLQKIRESGLDKILPSYGGLYVGVSAGSIVVGPNIEAAAPWDENDINLSDTTGLNIVNFSVIPHFQADERSILEELRNQADYKIIELTDDQAILVENGVRKLIGQS